MAPKWRPPARPRRTKQELLQLWKKLDANNSGYVTVEEVLRQTGRLEQECPEFIAGFDQVASGGKVSRQAFLDLCLGVPPKRGRSNSNASRRGDKAIDLVELRALFDEVATDGEIRLADLVAHKARIKARYPPLLERFSAIDLNNSSTITWDELRVFAGGIGEWLDHRLAAITGLDLLKNQIRNFHQSVVLDRERMEAGHAIQSNGSFHMIFQGNPGTGKTTLARLMAELLHRIGITKSDTLVEVQRDKLVAEYVGQTGPKTQKAIQEAKDGVLFIDEAYRLSASGGKSDFGTEAIEQLMGAMNDPPGKAPIMVFAGYPDDMDAFMKANAGLYRRIRYTFDFTDYSPDDLADILERMATSNGFQLAPELLSDDRAELAQLIVEGTDPRARELMNGGLCERLFDFAKQALDKREIDRTQGRAPSVVITASDVRDACARIPPPPERDGGGGGATPMQDSTRQLRAAEARANAAEAQVQSLEARLKRLDGADAGGGTPPDYEIAACCRYCFGCMFHFLCIFMMWCLALIQRCCQAIKALVFTEKNAVKVRPAPADPAIADPYAPPVPPPPAG